MKVLVVVPTLARGGGAERVVSLLTQAWSRLHDVVVVVFARADQSYDACGRIIDLGVPAASMPWSRAYHASIRVLRLIRLIGSERPERILSFMETANYPTVLACALTSRLNMLTVSVRNNPARLPLYHRVLMPFLYRLPSRVVAVSEGVAGALIRSTRLPSGRARAIPNPVDVRFVEAGAQKPVPAAQLPDGKYILAVGRLVRQKGFDLLIGSFSKIVDRFPITLLILGDGQDRAALEDLVERLNLGGRVLMPGIVENPYAFMARSELFVLPSRWEGWPNVLMEAMASCSPVVAFDCPFGPREIIEDGVSGLLVPAEDVETLAAVLTKVLQDEDLRARLKKNGRRSVEAFDVDVIASRWLAP